MAATKSNLELLTEAHVINPAHVSEHDHQAINGLSSDEVATLIRLREKLGATASGKDHLRPNFPV